MCTLTIDTDLAKELGINAARSGAALGTNPFDLEGENERHEAWLDGWVEETEGQRDHDELFMS